MADDEKKIIIDEDWKTQVQREKEEVAKVPVKTPGEETEDAEAGEPAPASFEGLVSTLAVQGMVALGAIAPRDTKQVMVNLEEARYIMDLLTMLRDKTKGNLNPQEQGGLNQMLAELQRVFVMRSQQLQESAMLQAGVGPQARPR